MSGPHGATGQDEARKPTRHVAFPRPAGQRKRPLATNEPCQCGNERLRRRDRSYIAGTKQARVSVRRTLIEVEGVENADASPTRCELDGSCQAHHAAAYDSDVDLLVT